MEICKQQSEFELRNLPAISIYGYVGGGQTFFLDQSIGIDETNTFQLKCFIWHENWGRNRFGRFLGVRVGVACSHNKLVLLTRLRNLNLKSQFSIFDSFRDIRVHVYDIMKFVGGF